MHNCTFSARSSSLSANDTADWEMCSRTAASVSVPVSATVTKYSSCRRENPGTLVSFSNVIPLNYVLFLMLMAVSL
jgi:hypothetical protein